jgi:ATP-dependent Clp protease, protease subunit
MSTDTVYISFSAEISQASTEGLLGVCGQLIERRVSNVHLMLSTPGGSVMNGLNLYNVLKAMPFRLTTHNAGNVDSIGNVVFLAGEERFSSPHATFMFHGVGFDINGQARFEEKTLRERLTSIQADQTRISKILCERTSLTTDEANQLFLEAVTKDPDYARSKGIIHDVREVKVPDGATFVQLVFKR